jgi:ABC-type multidrug transport system fused ATPase/permease subunit
LIVPEAQDEGNVTLKDVTNFLSFSTGRLGYFVFFLFSFGSSFTQLFTTFWISTWTMQDADEQQKSIYPTVFVVLILLYLLLNFVRALIVFFIIIVSTTKMHEAMVERVIRTYILFFDSNPIGRILTRFSKDVTALDLVMPVIFIMFLIAKKAKTVMRETQRMDSVFRGPIHSTFTYIVNGLVSLRAYDRLGYFRESFIDQLERSCNISFTYVSVNRWMGICLDQVCLTFSAFTCLFSLLAKSKVDP